MSMSFSNAPFYIVRGASKTAIYATQATIDEKLDFERVDVLGNSTAGIIESSRIQGTFSTDFYLTKAAYDACIALKGLTSFSGGMEDIGFDEAYMSEFSISMEPLSPITASLKGAFFTDGINRTFARQGTPTFSSSEITHGARSLISLSSGLYTAQVSWTQNFTPNYTIGGAAKTSGEPISYKSGGGEIRCSISGSGLQEAVSNCKATKNITLTLKNVCGVTKGSIVIEDLNVASSSVTVTESDGVVGTMELIGYF